MIVEANNKMKKVIVMAVIFSALLALMGCGKSMKTKYTVADAYQGLRLQALNLKPAEIGLTPSSNRMCGILMETGYPEAVATLVAIADGTVSLYFSNGGGIIGVGQHDGPRKAGIELLSTAEQFLQQAKPTKVFPLPEVGRTRFYFITFEGVFTIEAGEEDLGGNREPLSPLFHKAHEVITQARLAEESVKESTGKMLHAATTGNPNELKTLLESGISVDVADHTGLTPLMAASYAGKPETVRFLLDSGARIDATDESGYTALMFACNSGEKPCVELLVGKGANINHQDKDSSTPLMFAAQHAHNDILRILLVHGADPEFKGKHGISAIGFAQQNGHSETEKILLKSKKGPNQ
jgi:hypothetical protein